MWIAYSPRVDSAGDAVAELPNLAQNLFEDLGQYAVRAEPSWRPDIITIPKPRVGIEVAYVDNYGVVCPLALFLVCPPEEGPDGPERLWWLRAIPYPVREGDSAYKMLVRSAASWLRSRPYVVNS
jgi:hypothetical protein|nr:MAG TPA: hypothetical protein [Caudoviricetes sp.]